MLTGIFSLGKGKLFLTLSGHYEGHQRRNITPYMHAMVYHVPQMMKEFRNIKQFSGQGTHTILYKPEAHMFV